MSYQLVNIALHKHQRLMMCSNFHFSFLSFSSHSGPHNKICLYDQLYIDALDSDSGMLLWKGCPRESQAKDKWILLNTRIGRTSKPASYSSEICPMLFSLFLLFFCPFAIISLSFYICVCVCVCVCVCIKKHTLT